MSVWRYVPGDPIDVLTIVDHASNRVPDGIDLGIESAVRESHRGWDIGAAALAEAMGFPAFLANVSRLVVDLNREVDAPALVPVESDGISIPGNRGDLSGRATHWHDYHDALGVRIAANRPKLLLSLHSFTPQLTMRPAELRPWQVGILYNQDDRAARIAIARLGAAGVNVGDQLPYSGKVLNATMNRHGEAAGIPYLGVEMRQDLIADETGVAHWARVLRPVIDACLDAVP